MNESVCPQGTEDGRYGNRLSEHPALQHYSEDGLSPGNDRPSVSVPLGLRVLPDDGGRCAHRAVLVLPKVHIHRER